MLQEKFTELVNRYTADTDLAQTLWVQIEEAYSSKSRHYHNLIHLEHVIKELEEAREQIQDWDTVLFAAYYHDIVYNPTDGDNEERSAAIASKNLKAIGYPSSKIDACTTLILATKSHTDTDDIDTALFTDADLAILGQQLERYKLYTQHIRTEYSMYPDVLYYPGRATVLRHFLQMKRIFKTDHFYRKYELQARENISWELERLGKQP